MIIKGLFSNKDNGDDKNQRKASIAKYCEICQNPFKKGTDNVRLAHCNDCTSHERHLNVAHWKQVFANKKANSLSPDMQKLAEKLAANRFLVEGNKMSRAAGSNIDRSERNLNEIRKTQSSLNHVDFGVVKAQVKEMIPSILSELGLSKKVNADLLVDLIVPIKIASPIIDSQSGRSALKSIVHEALKHLDVNRDMKRESSIRPHGETPKYNGGPLLNEGFGRVSNDYGNRSRLIASSDMNGLDHDFRDNGGEVPELDAANAFAPDNGADDMNGMDMNPSPGASDPMSETGPSADVANSESLDGSVNKLDDAEADAMINGQMPPTPGAGKQQPPMPNEGVGTYSGGDNMVPDASEMADMPQEGIKRVDQAGPDMASRQIASLKSKIVKKSNLNLFSFAGKVSAQLPVQSVKLSSTDRTIIQNYPPINKLAAVFSDSSKLAWNYYLTDSGYLMISAENTFHAKSLEAFADFVESDRTFTKWASLPEELQSDVPPVLNEEHTVDEMAMPESVAQPSVPGGEGTPGFNEIPETNLSPSQDNSMGGGLMNQQDAIFDNSGDDSNPAEVEPAEEDVLDTASEMLPHIEKMFPEDSSDTHHDMAITAALELLTKKTAVIKNELKKKTASDLGTDFLKSVAPHAKNLVDKGINKLPPDVQNFAQPVADAVKPYIGIAKPENGNGLLGDISNKIPGLPNYKSPKTYHASLVAKKAASLMPYINDMYGTESKEIRFAIALEAAYNFLKTAAPVMEMPSPEVGKISEETKQKWKNSPAFTNGEFNEATPSQVIKDNGIENAVPINNTKIPPDKQRNIDQIVKQLNQPEGSNNPENIDKPEGINGHDMLLNQLHRITPHLNDEQRKNLIPQGLHSRLDNIVQKIKQRDLDNIGQLASESSEIRKITADLSQDDFELSVEALLELGYSEDAIMYEAERRG